MKIPHENGYGEKKGAALGKCRALPSPVFPMDRITGCEEIGFSSRRLNVFQGNAKIDQK
jgi:hypothetical protein